MLFVVILGPGSCFNHVFSFAQMENGRKVREFALSSHYMNQVTAQVQLTTLKRGLCQEWSKSIFRILNSYQERFVVNHTVKM